MLLDSIKVEFIPCVPYCPRHHCPASNSSCGSFSTSKLNKLKNSRASFEHFWSLPQHISYTFLAKGHSHRRCPTDSDNWRQNSQWGSTDTFGRERFSLVGSILEQARHKKVLTFGGTFKVQIFFPVMPILPSSWVLNSGSFLHPQHHPICLNTPTLYVALKNSKRTLPIYLSCV